MDDITGVARGLGARRMAIGATSSEERGSGPSNFWHELLSNLDILMFPWLRHVSRLVYGNAEAKPLQLSSSTKATAMRQG